MHRICAGIVTYNPDLDLLLKCYNSIKDQVEKVFIVDNGSFNSSFLCDILEDSDIFYYKTNHGIAKALNQLCKMAIEDGYDWILTMDQDSICSGNMIEAFTLYIDEQDIGIIAPRVVFKDGQDIILSTKNSDEVLLEIPACITSGSLTRLSAWKKIGGFDEWFFIDHVDNEFCLHLRKEGYRIIRVNCAELSQRAGDMNVVMFFGKKIMVTNYSDFRNFHIARNTIYYIRKYRNDINVLREILILIYFELKKLIFEKNRMKTISSAFKGVKQGMCKEIEYKDYT